jgi:hypothetical protein
MNRAGTARCATLAHPGSSDTCGSAASLQALPVAASAARLVTQAAAVPPSAAGAAGWRHQRSQQC